MKNFELFFGYKNCAGLICLCCYLGKYDFNFHLFPNKRDWIFGYKSDWYDGTLHLFGFGPLLLICWSEF